MISIIHCNPVIPVNGFKGISKNRILENITWTNVCGSKEIQSSMSAALSSSAQLSISQSRNTKSCTIINAYERSFTITSNNIRNAINIDELTKNRFHNFIEQNYKDLPKYDHHTSNAASSTNKVTKKSKLTVHQQKIKSLTKSCQLNTDDMQKWYSHVEFFFVAFKHLSDLHSDTTHENSSAEYNELMTLHFEAKHLLCHIEAVIHRLTNFQRPIIISSKEDMKKKLLTFRNNNNSDFFTVDIVDTTAVKVLFNAMVNNINATINEKFTACKAVRRLRNNGDKNKKKVKGLGKKRTRHANKRKRNPLRKKKQLTTK